MHIIFGYISSWHVPILKVLSHFKFNVYYLYINAKTTLTFVPIYEAYCVAYAYRATLLVNLDITFRSCEAKIIVVLFFLLILVNIS